MPWQTKSKVQADLLRLQRKVQIDDADVAGKFAAVQASLDALQKQLDAISKRLDEAQAAQSHTLTVSVTYSQDKTKMNKTAVVTATCIDSGSHALSKAALYLDDNLVGEDTSSPYTWDLDTTKYSNADHKLKVGFWCVNGGYGEKEETVTIDNIKAAGGGGTQYKQSGGPGTSTGGGTTTEPQGCTVTIYDIRPPSGSSLPVSHFTVTAKAKCSEGHPITSLTGPGTYYFTWDDNRRMWNQRRIYFTAKCSANTQGVASALYSCNAPVTMV